MRSLLKRDVRKKNGVNYKEMTHFIKNLIYLCKGVLIEVTK